MKGAAVRCIRVSPEMLYHVAFSSAGDLVAAAGVSGMVSVAALPSGKRLTRLQTVRSPQAAGDKTPYALT